MRRILYVKFYVVLEQNMIIHIQKKENKANHSPSLFGANRVNSPGT